jgi:hypothetical protein
MVGFEIKCKKCGSTSVEIGGTPTNYGIKVEIRLICSNCKHEEKEKVNTYLYFSVSEMDK